MPFLSLVFHAAAVPVAVLLALAASGFAAFWPALAGIVLILAACVLSGLLWARGLARLAAAVRRIEARTLPGQGENPPVLTEAAPDSVLPALLAPLGREIARLSRHLAAHAERTARERRADTLILESLPDPLIVLRADRSVSRLNPAATAILGADLAAVLRHPALREAQDRALLLGGTATAALTIPGLVTRDLLATIVPVQSTRAEDGQAVLMLSDRTRERSAERSHTDFVANVSHELRTPLASLIGFTQTLLGPARDDPLARERFLTIMAEQGARMNRLIDDLLNLARIELAEHQPPSEPVDLVTLLPGLVAGYEPRLAEDGGKIAVEIAGGLPPVPGDADQIARVAQNLLDNAVRYGKPGGTVRLSARPAPPGPPWPVRPGVLMVVTDEGAGIPAAHLPRVTERFYRVDKSRSRAAGGTGLGLAIVRHIVNRHRGQLLIESEEGHGTTVSVWLPLGRGEGG